MHVLQVITKAADMHGCAAEVTWRDPPYIPTVNNLEMVAMVEEAAQGLVGEERWQRLTAPTMAAEDFGFMARASRSLLHVAACVSVLAHNAAGRLARARVAQQIPAQTGTFGLPGKLDCLSMPCWRLERPSHAILSRGAP